MITIVDYGLGNILAFRNIYSRLNIPIRIASNYVELEKAKKLILPGVGAFDWAMSRLNASGMRDVLDQLVLGENTPVLGVCVGMQMMANGSHEGELPGLGWITGHVRKLDENRLQGKTRLPHMGWNSVCARDHPLFNDIIDPQFYFLHSYSFYPEFLTSILGETTYGTRFASVVHRDNIFGVQFHPEKSHNCGVQLLRNFAFL